jgi:hypothetical protein
MTERERPFGPRQPTPPASIDEGRKEATKTYVEQTKLLTTLASAFLVAPAGLLTFIAAGQARVSAGDFILFLISEVFFVASILCGYLVMGSVAGSQDDRSFDVFRPATMRLSLAQLFSYLAGMTFFVIFAWAGAAHSWARPKVESVPSVVVTETVSPNLATQDAKPNAATPNPGADPPKR